MNLLWVLIVVLLVLVLFGGWGYRSGHYAGPSGIYYGGGIGVVGIILIVLLILLLMGRL